MTTLTIKISNNLKGRKKTEAHAETNNCGHSKEMSKVIVIFEISICDFEQVPVTVEGMFF